MSIDIMNRLWWRQDLSLTEKFIAIALGDAASDDGVCWPAHATIAQKCSCSIKTVKNAINGLVGKGLLRKLARPDQSNCYIFNIDSLPHVERQRRQKEPSPLAAMTGVTDTPDMFGTGVNGSMTGVNGSMTGVGDTYRTVIEPSIEPSSRLSGDFEEKSSLPQVDVISSVEEAWHLLKEDHPGIADIRKIDESLGKLILLRTRQHVTPGQTDIDMWKEFFRQIRNSRFLCGLAPPGRDRDVPFKLSLGWACKPNNFREIINGKYSDERGRSNGSIAADGRRLGPTEQAVNGTLERIRQARERGGAAGNQRGHVPGTEIVPARRH